MLEAVAYAKLNLSLHVTGRRADGYHLLDSLVAFTAFGDELRVLPSDALSLTVEGEFSQGIPTDERNLVIQVAERVRGHFDISHGASIVLDKSIPVGAGLGGGSSDAAMAAWLLCRLWGIEASTTQLSALLAPLGADMSACAYAPQPVWMRGIGDEVSLAPALPEWCVVLVNPRVSLLTADVYRALSLADQSPVEFAGDIDDYVRQSRNDLEVAARSLCPAIEAVLAALAEQGADIVRLCGSGATCFGLFANKEAALEAASSLALMHTEWWVQPTCLMPG